MKQTIKRFGRFAGRFLLALAAAAMLFICLPDATMDAEAKTTISEADIKALRDKIAATTAKSKDAQDQIEQLKDEIDNYLSVKALLDQQIANIENNLEDTSLLIEKYEGLIADREERIALREAEIALRYDNFRERLRLSYENGTQNYLELLVSSQNLIEFITRADNLGSVLSYEQTLLDELDREVSDLNAMKASLEIKKNEYVELGILQNDSEKELLAKRKEAEDYLAKLQKDEAAYERVQAKAKKDLTSLDKELEETIKKYEQQQRAAAEQKLLWPLSNNYLRISSKYGSRILYGVQDFHLGVDIPAPYGTEIYAANPGKVIKATWSNSYGWYILIDHGGTTSTLYAHCSKLKVSANDVVKRGQVIGLVGATGNAYGYHLHFEVRESGKTTNPLVKNKLVVLYNGKYVDPVAEGILRY